MRGVRMEDAHEMEEDEVKQLAWSLTKESLGC